MPLAVRITLLRQLTRIDLARFGPKLAEALITRSHQVSVRPGFVRQRSAAADEAVTLYRRLVRDRPGRHEVGLARALVAQGSVPDDRTVTSALEQGWEAVGYVENATDRDALNVLAAAHLMMANLLAPSAPQDALPLAERARATWLRCAPLGVRERTGLARSLTVLGDCRAKLDAPAEALAAHDEAAEIFRRLPGWARLRYLPARLSAMTGLAESLSAERRWAQALILAASAREDLNFWARWEPLRARPTLGRLLFVIAECHAELGEPEAAVTTAKEAVVQVRWLAEHDPVRYHDWLVAALRTLASVLHSVGRYEEAAWTAGEARAAQGD